MTVIDLRGLETSLGGAAPIAEGRVTARYWAGDRPYVNIAGADITFPAPVQVRIIDGEPVAVLDVPPTLDLCCVRWTVEAVGVAQAVDRYTTIPPTGPIAFGALVDVDPTTYQPTADAIAAWEATIAEVRGYADAAAESADALTPGRIADTVEQITHPLYFDRF